MKPRSPVSQFASGKYVQPCERRTLPGSLAEPVRFTIRTSGRIRAPRSRSEVEPLGLGARLGCHLDGPATARSCADVEHPRAEAERVGERERRVVTVPLLAPLHRRPLGVLLARCHRLAPGHEGDDPDRGAPAAEVGVPGVVAVVAGVVDVVAVPGEPVRLQPQPLALHDAALARLASYAWRRGRTRVRRRRAGPNATAAIAATMAATSTLAIRVSFVVSRGWETVVCQLAIVSPDSEDGLCDNDIAAETPGR